MLIGMMIPDGVVQIKRPGDDRHKPTSERSSLYGPNSHTDPSRVRERENGRARIRPCSYTQAVPNIRPYIVIVTLVSGLAAGCTVDQGAEAETSADTTILAEADTAQSEIPDVDSMAADAGIADSIAADAPAADTPSTVAQQEPTPAESTPPEQRSPVESILRETVVVQNFGLKIFWAAFVLGVVWLVIRATAFILNTLSERSAERRLFYKRMVPIARILLWSLAVYIIIRGVFQVDANSLFAAAAAIGVAVGFAAQDLLKNIFGGLVIISDRPFQVGDKILVQGTYGEVTNIGLRSTRLVTPDDSMVTVPNAQVVDGQVSNANSGALHCQVVTELYLPAITDELTARRIAHEAAASSKYVYRNMPITVLVEDEFKETFLTRIKIKAYVFDTRHEMRLKSDITERARRGFRAAGLIDESDVVRAWGHFGVGAGRGEPSND